MSSEQEPAAMGTGRGRISGQSWLMAIVAVCMAVLGPLSAERYELLWLPAVPGLLLVVQWRTASGLAGNPRRRYLLPIFPIGHAVLAIVCQSLTGFAHWQTVGMYAVFAGAALIVLWQLLKFGGIVAGSRRPRIDVS